MPHGHHFLWVSHRVLPLFHCLWDEAVKPQLNLPETSGKQSFLGSEHLVEMFFRTCLCMEMRPGASTTTHLSKTLLPPHGAPAVEFDQQRAVVVQRSQEEVKSLLPLALTAWGLQHTSLLLHHDLSHLVHLHFDKEHFRGDSNRMVTHLGQTGLEFLEFLEFQSHLPWLSGDEEAGRFWEARTWSWMRPLTGWKQVVRCSSEWQTWKKRFN